MILIAAYWLFLFILTLPLGIVAVNTFKLTAQNPVITVLLGVVLLTCGFTLTAFLFPLGFTSLLVWSLMSMLSGFYYKAQLKQQLLAFRKSIIELPSYLKIITGIFTFAALLKSAQYPFILDNESYYIQTIKWLNEYGFVKGLANLHIFFAQNSAWHVLQAGTNFSFITNKINDINGFVFTLCTIYYLTEGIAFSTGKKVYWLSFMPVLSTFPFLFLDVPSPDLPLLLITPIILHLFIEYSNSNSNFKIALLLFIFLVFIKITIAPLGILFLAGLIKKENIKFALITALPIALLWIAKNIIISGLPLYPFPYLSQATNWAIPKSLLDLTTYQTSGYGYKRHGKLLPEGTAMTVKLLHWIKQDQLAGIINKLTLVVLLTMPFVILKNNRYRLVYIALVANFLAILFTSPQFRYFLHITLAASLFIISALYNYAQRSSTLYKAITIMGCIIIFTTFLNSGLPGLTSNKHHQAQSKIRMQQLLIPEGITKFPDMQFTPLKLGNLNYYSPKDNFFRYGTSNGPLPCVNSAQIKYMKYKLAIIPQQRTGNIKDGFYSAKAAKK